MPCVSLSQKPRRSMFHICHIYQSQWNMTDFFSFSFHFHRNSSWIVLLFQRLLWTSTSDTSIMKRYNVVDIFCIFFFLLNISIRGNPIKMCCFEVLKINRCSGVTQIVRSLWKRRGENCFCLTSMTFLFFSFIFLLELQTKCSSL